MKTTVTCIVIGLVVIGLARWWRNAIRRAEELVGLDDSVDFVDGVDFVDNVDMEGR